MDIATAIVTVIISTPLWAFATHLVNRRARHADARLKNIEADQKELAKKKNEVDYYRSTIENLVADMEALRLAQDATDQRYQENTAGLHEKLDEATRLLKQANETISRLETEGKLAGEETRALAQGLKRANDALDKAHEEISELRKEVKDGNIIITELRKEISKLLVDRAEKSEARKKT